MTKVGAKFEKTFLECSVCKHKFGVWLSKDHYSQKNQKKIKAKFHLICPACQLKGISGETKS